LKWAAFPLHPDQVGRRLRPSASRSDIWKIM
jgi:hypothetical protein